MMITSFLLGPFVANDSLNASILSSCYFQVLHAVVCLIMLVLPYVLRLICTRHFACLVLPELPCFFPVLPRFFALSGAPTFTPVYV